MRVALAANALLGRRLLVVFYSRVSGRACVGGCVCVCVRACVCV